MWHIINFVLFKTGFIKLDLIWFLIKGSYVYINLFIFTYSVDLSF